MAKFNSAKMIGADDKGFQQKYNELIDLLDTGYVVESMRSGKHLKIQLNSDVGMKMTVDGSSIFSVDPVTGRVVIGYYDDTLDDLSADIEGIDGIIDSLGDLAYEDLVESAKLGTTIIDGGYIKSDLLTASNIITGNLYANLVNIISSSGTSRLELVGTGLNGYLDNFLRVQVEYDRLEFHRAGSSVGNIRSEYVDQVWQGSTIGDSLFIESAGNNIVFNAASGTTAPSMVVAPTWVDIPTLVSESIGISSSYPQKWTIGSETSDADFVINHYLGSKLKFNTSGLYVSGTKVSLDGHTHSYVPTTRTVNSKSLSADITLTASDVGALPLSGGTMTGQLNMGSNNIVGSTSDCWITARRIGLGVSANSTYTMDAGTTGDIRFNTAYAQSAYRIGASIGKTKTFRVYDTFGTAQYRDLVFVGGILVDYTPDV